MSLLDKIKDFFTGNYELGDERETVDTRVHDGGIPRGLSIQGDLEIIEREEGGSALLALFFLFIIVLLVAAHFGYFDLVGFVKAVKDWIAGVIGGLL